MLLFYIGCICSRLEQKKMTTILWPSSKKIVSVCVCKLFWKSSTLSELTEIISNRIFHWFPEEISIDSRKKYNFQQKWNAFLGTCFWKVRRLYAKNAQNMIYKFPDWSNWPSWLCIKCQIKQRFEGTHEKSSIRLFLEMSNE